MLNSEKEIKSKKGRKPSPITKKDIKSEVELQIVKLIKKLVKKESLK
jgi:hypothetical protein